MQIQPVRKFFRAGCSCFYSLFSLQGFFLKVGKGSLYFFDTSNHILYVTDLGNDEIFGDRCGIDCNEAIEKYNLCYVNYDAEDDVRTIEFEDFQVGDDVIIGLYDGEIENAFNKTAVAEQVQLATQRLN